MTPTLSLAFLVAGFTVLAGCTNDPSANAQLEGQRAPLAGQSSNTLNSPTSGPTSEGLAGGTETANPPELDPDRGTKIR